jgi:PAS domain S-box-containing protein
MQPTKQKPGCATQADAVCKAGFIAQPRVWTYAFAALAVSAALLVRGRLGVAFGERPLLILFVLPIIVSAYLGGLGPGLLATLLAAFCTAYFLVPPVGRLEIALRCDLLQWAILIACGVVVSVLVDGLHRARRRLLQTLAERERASAALRETEEHYRLLAEHTEDFVSVHDSEERRLYISPSYFRATDWTPEEVQSTPWDARLHPDDLPKIKQAREANRAGQTTLIEHRVRCRKGNWLWIEARSKPIMGSDGRMQRLVVWSHDITERLRAEQALRASEQLLREVIDSVPYYIFAKDREGRYLFVNRAGSLCYGLEPRDLVGHLDADFAYNREAMAAFLKDDQEVIDTGNPKFIAEEQVAFADGSKHWVQTAKMAFTPPGATERAVLGVAVDITERKLAEQALRDSEEKFQRIAANIDDVLYSVDAQTREFLFVSPAFGQLLGYTLDDVRQMGGRRAFLMRVIQDGKFAEQEGFMDALQSRRA